MLRSHHRRVSLATGTVCGPAMAIIPTFYSIRLMARMRRDAPCDDRGQLY
jgi:hypothetical protein